MRRNVDERRALESLRATAALKAMGVPFKGAGETIEGVGEAIPTIGAANPILPYYEVPKAGIIAWIWRTLGWWLDKPKWEDRGYEIIRKEKEGAA